MPQDWNFEPSQENEDDVEQYFDEDASVSQSGEKVNTDVIDVIEGEVYQEEIMYSSGLEASDLRSFVDEYLNQGNIHRLRTSKMIAGLPITREGGDPEKFVDLINENIIENQRISQYSETQDFIDDLASLVNHEDFDRFASSKQQFTTREDELSAIANFLDTYGEEEEIFGVKHLSYTFDEELDQSYRAPDEEDNVITEREYVEKTFKLNNDYKNGFIGKTVPDKRNEGSLEITMSFSNVADYTED